MRTPAESLRKARLMAPFLACPVLSSMVSAPEELLHPTLPSDLYMTSAADVLQKTYRLEMQATLRLEDKGAAPDSTHLDISERPTQRNFYDDWDFFLHETDPQPLTEWRYCLSWLCRGVKDGSTYTSCLGRTETSLEGAVVERHEVVVERAFSAGMMRCALTSIDGGSWLIAALQVQISPDYIPGGPLLTWHDAEPFGEAPAEEEAPEAEGEEAEEPA
jgi:hypothetical protein